MSSAVAKKQINPLLAAYLLRLQTNPLQTKAITSGILSFFQEILATHLAGVPVRPAKNASTIWHVLAAAKIDVRAFKLAIYGAFVSAPLSHFLIGNLQKFFAGKTGTGAKVGQILANNLLAAPIQTAVYLASIAVVNGARSVDEIMKTVKGGFFAVIRITWATSPLAMVFAQKFLAPELWVPFFNAIQFVLGTYFNTKVKKIALAAAARKAKKDKEREGQGEPKTD